MYLVFGVLTTVVNYLVYFGCLQLGWDYRLSNALAWFLSVMFAFWTNKFFVFASDSMHRNTVMKELLLFYWYRGLSFILDMGGMILFISVLHWSDFWAKTVVQVVVILLNYVFSKWLIFKEKPQNIE
ncbi:GtrA family protein [Enterococcus canis]|nr:GtrA family protein [Enterococcus canis]